MAHCGVPIFQDNGLTAFVHGVRRAWPDAELDFTGQPARIAVPVLIDVLTAYLIGALRKCETYAERQQWLQRAVDHLRLGAERP